MPQQGRAQQGPKGGQGGQPQRGGPRAGGAAASQGSSGAGNARAKEQELVAQVTAVLGAFDYTEADIQALVKACNYDAALIQQRVNDSLEEMNDGWNTSDTKNEKATRAAEAKERRAQLEKQQADEAVRVAEERTKKEDAKYKALQQELALRKTRANAAKLGGPAAEAAATVKPFWQSPDEKTSGSAAQPAEHAEAPAEEEEEEWQAEEPQEQWSAPQVEEEQWQHPQSYGSSRWTPKAVQQESTSSAPVETTQDVPTWSSQDAVQAATVSEPSAPMPTTAPAPAYAPRQLPPEAQKLAVDDAVLSSPSVHMPPSYDLLFGSGTEPAVYFGTLHVDDTSGVVVSLRAPAGPAAQAEVPEPESAPQRNGRQRPGRGNWVPRGSGKGDDVDGKAAAAEDEGESKPQRGRKGGGRSWDQAEQGNAGDNSGGKERKKGKGGKGKKGKADGKGDGGEARASRGEGKGASKGEGKGASKGRRQGDWQGQGEGARKGDREKGGKS